MAPRDEAMLVHMLRTALAYDDGPVGAALPARRRRRRRAAGRCRGSSRSAPARSCARATGSRCSATAAGVAKALEAAALLAERGISVTVADARFGKPIDAGLAAQLAAEHELLVTVEEGVLAGGFGSAVWETLSDARHRGAGSCGSGCPTATSRTARRSCCTRRSGSPASGSPSGSRRPWPSSADTQSEEPHQRFLTACAALESSLLGIQLRWPGCARVIRLRRQTPLARSQ